VDLYLFYCGRRNIWERFSQNSISLFGQNGFKLRCVHSGLAPWRTIWSRSHGCMPTCTVESLRCPYACFSCQWFSTDAAYIHSIWTTSGGSTGNCGILCVLDTPLFSWGELSWLYTGGWQLLTFAVCSTIQTHIYVVYVHILSRIMWTTYTSTVMKQGGFICAHFILKSNCKCLSYCIEKCSIKTLKCK